MKFHAAALAFIVLSSFAQAGRQDGSVIDSCDYASDQAAQSAWIAREGSSPAAVRAVDGKPALVLRCNFAGTAIGRGVWDRAVALDLSQAEGIELEFHCANAGPVSSFTLYLKTEAGWHSAAFSPRVSEGWETILLRKLEMREEGRPGGWDKITGLRIAAWKGDNEDTEFMIRNVRRVGVLGGDTHIMILRGSDAGEVDARERRRYAEIVSALFGDVGLRHAIILERELTADALGKARLVVLPYNPGMSDSAVALLRNYLARGGRLLAFYAMPHGLEEATGIPGGKHRKAERSGEFSAIRPSGESLGGAPKEAKQASWNIAAVKPAEGRTRVLAEWFDSEGRDSGFPAILASDNTVFMTHVLLEDDRANKARLLLSLSGVHRPEFWESVIARRRENLAKVARSTGIEPRDASRLPSLSEDARARLVESAAFREHADVAAKEGHFGAAVDALDAATAKFREAFCLAQSPRSGEFRAFWCHSAYGVKGMTWDQAIARLKENGFTAIMPNMLWGGVAYYPGEVLPVAADIATRGDQLAACVAACRKHGLQIHVWKVDWNLGRDAPPAFVEKMRAAKRLQRSIGGDEEPWLCPSNPDNQDLERAAMVEVARKYPVDGIHFDYIRYPGPDHCFCGPCRGRFEKATGNPVAAWPKDVLPKGARREEWIKWCQDNITTVVKTTSGEVRKVRPGIKVSAAVFRNWDVDSRIVMQDWKLWCERGYLDFVCPMDYTNNAATFDRWMKKQKEWAGPAQLCPGIGASASHASLSAEEVIRQIGITQKHDTMGFIIFNYGENEARDLAPMLGLGMTKR